MIIWRGWGILVLPIVSIVGILGAGGTSNNLTAIRLAIAAIIVWKLGKHLNSKPGRLLQDQETKEIIELKDTHDLFWINFEYWAIPTFIAAFIFVFLEN